MLTQSEQGEILFNPKRCSQCGVCLGICPNDAILAIYSSKRQYYDIVLDKTKCTLCGLCLQICPASHLGDDAPNEEQIIHARSFLLGYAKDEKVRWNSSSGGCARTLLNFALSVGYVDAAYSLIYPGITKNNKSNISVGYDVSGDGLQQTDIDYPYIGEAEGCWLTKPVNQKVIPCSLYRPVVWGRNIKAIKKGWSRVLLVGLPCQLKSAIFYMNIAHRNISVLMVTIICRKQKTFGYTQYVKHLVHKEKARDWDVVYRGRGWPGSSGIITKDGARFTSFSYPARCWNLPACDFCTDPLNLKFSDITLADPWGLLQPTEDEHGKNLVIVWTQAGKDFLSSAEAVLTTQNLSPKLALHSLDLNAIEQKAINARLSTVPQNNLSSALSRVWIFFNVKIAEWLTMHFNRQSWLLQFIRNVKTFLAKSF